MFVIMSHMARIEKEEQMYDISPHEGSRRREGSSEGKNDADADVGDGVDDMERLAVKGMSTLHLPLRMSV